MVKVNYFRKTFQEESVEIKIEGLFKPETFITTYLKPTLESLIKDDFKILTLWSPSAKPGRVKKIQTNDEIHDGLEMEVTLGK